MDLALWRRAQFVTCFGPWNPIELLIWSHATTATLQSPFTLTGMRGACVAADTAFMILRSRPWKAAMVEEKCERHHVEPIGSRCSARNSVNGVVETRLELAVDQSPLSIESHRFSSFCIRVIVHVRSVKGGF
jgi:hypothetical protein